MVLVTDFFALDLSYSDRKKNGLDKAWEIGHPRVTLMALYLWRMYIKAVIHFDTYAAGVTADCTQLTVEH